MTVVLRARGLGKNFGRRPALADCTLDIPAGRVVGLVGPNGAGKSTLLNLAVGMLTPTSGTIEVLGERPAAGPAQLARVGFVAQDAPTYPGLSIDEHLRLGARLNPGWDDALARSRIERLGLDFEQRARKLSGGQRAQLALTLGVAKRPELLILDEPVASLDPLARREFMQDLMESVAEHELSVVLSSHLVSDLERVCDHLIVLVASRVQLAGDLDTLAHHPSPAHRTPPRPRHAPGRPEGHLRKPHRSAEHFPCAHRRADPRPRLECRAAQPGGPRPGLHGPVDGARRAPARARGGPMIWLTWRQFRVQAATMAAALAGFAVILGVTGGNLADDYATGIAACTAQGNGCSNFVNRFFQDHQNPFLAVTAVVLILPALIGLFWGAPLIARELEAGTHRLVWNQSITRTRWLAVKLALTGLAVVIAAGLGSLAVDWWSEPARQGRRRRPVLADGAIAVRRTRHRADRLRGVLLRARRDRRDAGPPYRARDGDHDDRVRRRPDRDAATGTGAPHRARPCNRRDQRVEPRPVLGGSGRSHTREHGPARHGRLAPFQPHRRRLRSYRRGAPPFARVRTVRATPGNSRRRRLRARIRATNSRTASPRSSGSATGSR